MARPVTLVESRDPHHGPSPPPQVECNAKLDPTQTSFLKVTFDPPTP